MTSSYYTKHRLLELGLLKLCEILHMSFSGSSTPLNSNDEKIIREYLLQKLADWVDRNDKYSYYDRAVKQLIEITLIEPDLFKSNIDLRDKSLEQIITYKFYS